MEVRAYQADIFTEHIWGHEQAYETFPSPYLTRNSTKFGGD